MYKETKQSFLENQHPSLVMTGRVKSWLLNEKGRLPVSCTVFVVEDSMEGNNGIEASWKFVSHALRYGAGVAVDLSKLRARGTKNGLGLVASGPVSFAKIYSTLNEILRRGGVYKNGAVVCYLNIEHPDIVEFLGATPQELPWIKRAVYIDKNSIKDASDEVMTLLADKVNKGLVWLAKKQYDDSGERVYSNVCLEILLKHRSTCLLAHTNLGRFADISGISSGIAANMLWLCSLKQELCWDDSPGQEYLPQADNDQVGLGVIGLANLLAIHNVTYSEFIAALTGDVCSSEKALQIVGELRHGFNEAARIARSFRLKRAFTIAPTASCSYEYKDCEEFTTCPEISPPLSRYVDRDSDTFGVSTHDYGYVETTDDLSWQQQWRLLNAWQRLMEGTGMAHSISANIWNTQYIDADWIRYVFMPSDLKTTYYRLNTNQAVLNKEEIPVKNVYFEPVYDEYCEACGG